MPLSSLSLAARKWRFRVFKVVLALAAVACFANAQATQTTHETIPLWPDGAPNAQGSGPEDIPL